MNSSKQREKITPDDVHRIFTADFLDEGACRSWVLAKLHPSGARCPGCGTELQGEVALLRFWRAERLKCPIHECGKFFTALTGTFLAGSHFSFQEIILLFLALKLDLRTRYIAAVVGVNPETVRQWRKRLQVP